MNRNWERLIISLLLVAVSACGTKVGNPSQNGGTKKLPMEVSLPRFTFDLSKFFSELSLNPLMLFQAEQTDIQAQVSGLNQILKDSESIVNLSFDQGVRGVGRHEIAGEKTKFTIVISMIPDHPVYHYQAVICLESERFMELQWNENNTLVTLVRQFPTGKENKQHIKAEISIQNLENPELEFYVLKAAAKGPFIDSSAQLSDSKKDNEQAESNDRDRDQNFRNNDRNRRFNWILQEADELLLQSGLITQYADQTTAYRSVSGYQDLDSTAAQSIDVQEYMLGALFSSGKNNFIGYQKDHPDCSLAFSESEDIPAWCIGGSITSLEEQLTQNEIVEAWQTLRTYGLRSKSSLKIPEFFSNNSTCN